MNLFSLLLGILSWVMGFLSLKRRSPFCSAWSFLFCAVSLLLQILYTQHLVAIEDVSAIFDIHRAVTLAAAVLLSGTLLLNLPLLLRRKK